MEIWQRAKEQLLSAYRERSQKQPPEWLEEQRAAFLERFPPERLEEPRGEALLSLVHGRAPREGLFYELEFGQTSAGFGSVAGGSALKFRVYRSAEGEWKKKGPGTAPVTCSEAEAVRITEELMQGVVAGLRLADELDLATGRKEDWLRFQEAVVRGSGLTAGGAETAVLELGWAHKYLSIARPDLFSFHHSKHPLAQHLVRVGQIPEEGRYLLDWQWRQLLRSDPVLETLHPALLMWAAWTAFGSNTGYWRVGTDDGQTGEDRWPAMFEGGYVSIGGKQLGNLNELLEGLTGEAARHRIREILGQRWVEQRPSTVTNAANQIYSFFAQMSDGDRVAAMKGKRLLGAGVIDSEYEYVEGERQPHRRRVRWLDVNPTDWEGAPGLRTVVYNFAGRYAKASHLEHLIANGREVSVARPLAPSEITPLTELEARIQEVLERKDQVLLFGPPGTGKTYHARRTAQELVSRELFSGQAWPSLSEAQKREVECRITFCTFHPAYAYEDFARRAN